MFDRLMLRFENQERKKEYTMKNPDIFALLPLLLKESCALISMLFCSRFCIVGQISWRIILNNFISLSFLLIQLKNLEHSLENYVRTFW